MKLGIIGNGSFGAFIAKILHTYGDIAVYDDAMPETSIPFGDLARMDVIILAVPLDAYEAVLAKLRPILQPDTLVIDTCSVKVQSRDTMLRVLNNHKNLLMCHPLFGPQSAADGIAGHDIIITNAIGQRAEEAVNFCADTLELTVHRFTTEEHDKVMAYVHVLTFFVARGLSNMQIDTMPFKTPSYDMLTALIDLDAKHSDKLFQTIQRGNPYSAEVRRALIRSFQDLEQSFADSEHQ